MSARASVADGSARVRTARGQGMLARASVADDSALVRKTRGGGSRVRVGGDVGGELGLRGVRGRSRSHAERLVEIQRARLLHAAVEAVWELGYGETTVAHITTRARVSRRTFYELYVNREACLLAMLEGIAVRVAAEIASARAQSAAGAAGLPWRERVRVGLWALLSFLDREPVLARVLVVESARGDSEVLARREELLTGLAGVVEGGRLESARGAERGELTAEGLVGAAYAIVYARLLRAERRPLTGLLPELMAMIVLPYLGPAVARREQARHVPRALPARASEPVALGDPLEGVRMRLTYRTARVLEGVAELSGGGLHPSNREIAVRAGIVDAGQVSKLLARLERLGLLANAGGRHARGERNAWMLTEKGEWVTQSIRLHTFDDRRAA
jgi:AcrR family transcriptional regulator